jgi:glutathione S-transferase
MKLYYNPVSTYCQKVLTAFHEKNVSFKPEIVDLADPKKREEYKKINVMGKVPMVVLDDGWKIPESSIIIEYLDTHFDTGTRLIPTDKDQARQTRFFDRITDMYVTDSAVCLFLDKVKFRPAEASVLAAAKERLNTLLPVLNEHFAKKTWVMGDHFTMADCALAPALSVMRVVHPFDSFANVKSYFGRIVERPSFAKVLADAAPFVAKMGI